MAPDPFSYSSCFTFSVWQPHPQVGFSSAPGATSFHVPPWGQRKDSGPLFFSDWAIYERIGRRVTRLMTPLGHNDLLKCPIQWLLLSEVCNDNHSQFCNILIIDAGRPGQMAWPGPLLREGHWRRLPKTARQLLPHLGASPGRRQTDLPTLRQRHPGGLAQSVLKASESE